MQSWYVWQFILFVQVLLCDLQTGVWYRNDSLGRDYLYVQKCFSLTKENAISKCANYGGITLSIPTLAHLQFILTLISGNPPQTLLPFLFPYCSSTKSHIALGAECVPGITPKNNSYIYWNGDTFNPNIINWSDTEPDYPCEDEPGIGMRYISQTFDDISWQTSTAIICQRDILTPTMNNHLGYISVASAMNFTDAEKYCISEYNSHLATITNSNQQEMVYSLCIQMATINDDNCWIGLNDINIEGTFVFTDGTMNILYNKWNIGEPNDYGSGEDCAYIQLNNGGFWNDISCLNSKKFVCNPNVSFPTTEPTYMPSFEPSFEPTFEPSYGPSFEPALEPTFDPMVIPTDEPTYNPSNGPSFHPSNGPSFHPSNGPSFHPSFDPTFDPTYDPAYPTSDPTLFTTAFFGTNESTKENITNIEEINNERNSKNTIFNELYMAGIILGCISFVCLCFCVIRKLCGIYRSKVMIKSWSETASRNMMMMDGHLNRLRSTSKDYNMNVDNDSIMKVEMIITKKETVEEEEDEISSTQSESDSDSDEIIPGVETTKETAIANMITNNVTMNHEIINIEDDEFVIESSTESNIYHHEISDTKTKNKTENGGNQSVVESCVTNIETLQCV